MKIVKPPPPEPFTFKVPAETLAWLKLYQRWQKEECGTTWDVKELTSAILSTFLAEGDTEFLAWKKRQGKQPVGMNGVATTDV